MSTKTTQPLTGIRVIEAATFVAVPFAGMSLAQLGAEVIRVDIPGGGADFNRWPLAPQGGSLYWANLNKGKRSAAIDFRTPHGRELLLGLATAPGTGGGVFLDNVAGRGRLTYEQLRNRRPDVIHAHMQGRADGGPAVDYTANPAVGLPQMTGPEHGNQPVNHVLPAWDLLAGMTAANGVVAALHRRSAEGVGALVDVALIDVALSAVAALGWLAEADLMGCARPPQGNHIYGSFGIDFATADRRRVMVVALTPAQWRALCAATGTTAVFDAYEKAVDADLADETVRYMHREALTAILRPWFSQHTFAEVAEQLEANRALWGPYTDMVEAARHARSSSALVAEIDQPGIGPMLAATSPLRWHGEVEAPRTAPLLGADTDDVLATLLGLSSAEIGRLHDEHVVG